LLKTQYANLYSPFYGSSLDLNDSSHGFVYENLYKILKTDFKSDTNFSYESDAVVPVTSAFNDGHPDGFVQIGPEVNYDHTQMTGKNSTDPLFTQIKSVLATISSEDTRLVGHWTFDDSTNLGLDISGNANNGVPAPGYVSYSSDGKIGGAAKFVSGSGSGITVPNSDFLNFNGGITITAWVKLDAVDGKGTIISKSDYSSNEVYTFWATFWKTANNNMAAFFNASGVDDSGVSIPAGDGSMLL
jgi:hypothetical protein